MESQTTKAECTDGPILSIRPQTKLVFTAFKSLQQKAEEVRHVAQNVKPYLSVRLVTLLVRRLDIEFLEFYGTLAELADDNYRKVEGVNWTVVELAVQSRCVSEYARYCDLLSCMLQELESIAELLGLTEDLQFSGISDFVSNHDCWEKMLQALCTFDGSAGAALQISFTRIQQANKELVEIQRLSQKDPSPNFFDNLLMLRDHVSSAADILGRENGFHCQCSKPHQVYLRVKDCFKPGYDVGNSRAEKRGRNGIEEDQREGRGEKDRESENKKRFRFPWPFTSQREDPIQASPINQVAETSTIPPPMTTDPSDGLCAFLTDNMGARTKYPMDITIYRQDSGHKLLLSPANGRMKPDLRWVNPLPIHRRPEDTHRLELSTEQKLQLAHKVAFSLFYLFSTPWIRDSWISEDVYLTWQESSVGIVYPVFSRNASINASCTQESSHPKIPFTNCLGRFLVELWCGTSWSHLQKAFLAGDGPSGVVDPDSFIFTRLLNWVNDSKIAHRDKPFHLEGRSYFMAVQKCFMCDFNLGQLDQTSPLENQNSARWIYRHILRPLQYALEDFQIRQDRLYGSRLNLNPEILTPRNAKDMKRLHLFANEDIKGDRNKKEKAADDWVFRYGLVKKFVRVIGRERPDKPTDRIKVAILDTGVDVTHDDLQSLWIDGQIFYQNFVGIRSDIPQDNDGHGTHVVSILLQMAENVDIYVARVSPDGLNWKNSEVEDAIRWATNEKQVHIISISFGFPNADQSLEGIRRALLEAHAADVLIFAATGNDYEGNAISFPACLDEVISVASTDGDHQLSHFVPDLRVGKRLCAIGEAIEAAWIDEQGSTLAIHSSTQRKAGTSYATPVVAGVAAMIMDLIWSVKEDNEYHCQTLRTRRGMLAVLELMIWKNTKNETECLKPWMFFNEKRWGASSKGKKPDGGMSIRVFGTLRDTSYNIYGKGSLKR